MVHQSEKLSPEPMENWNSLVQAWAMQAVGPFADVRAVLRQTSPAEWKVQPHTRVRPARHYAEIFRFRRDEIGLSDSNCPGLSASIRWLDEIGDGPVLALSIKAESVSALLFAIQHDRVCAGFLLKREVATPDSPP